MGNGLGVWGSGGRAWGDELMMMMMDLNLIHSRGFISSSSDPVHCC